MLWVMGMFVGVNGLIVPVGVEKDMGSLMENGNMGCNICL